MKIEIEPISIHEQQWKLHHNHNNEIILHI